MTGSALATGHLQTGRGEYVTTAAAVELLGPDVTPDMIYDWVRRGLVSVAGRDGRRSVYALDQLQAAELATRGRGRHRRAPDGPRAPS